MTIENLAADQARREAERGSMQTLQYKFLGLALIISVSLTACMDGSNSTSAPRDGTSRTGGALERDIEDPSAFSKREAALWDGRPSLGGVWVAHPDVRSPERVIIRNTTNGQETIGALFRRERMNPGPAFQVSGEAAAAVGLLAGAPTIIEVVALRVEEAESAPPVAVESAPETPAATAPVETQPQAPVSGETETLIALPETEAAAPQRRGGLFGGIFGRNRASAPQADTPADIETQSLGDGPANAPVAAIMPSPAAPAPTTAPAPAPAPASTLAQPFIQLGIFSVESNARNAEGMARGAGLSARVVEGRAQGNVFWRVVVGPATTQAEQGQMLARVKSLGFNDAYAVRR